MPAVAAEVLALFENLTKIFKSTAFHTYANLLVLFIQFRYGATKPPLL